VVEVDEVRFRKLKVRGVTSCKHPYFNIDFYMNYSMLFVPMVESDIVQIIDHIAKEIRGAWITQDLRKYMAELFRWNTPTPDLINWYSHGSTLTNMTYYQHVFCVKLIQERRLPPAM
jgi:hypothetical protein